ncbi:hypothetical protein XBKQ1_180021 [Xenorhabdus bovienii str. kraussei Quebec]|uniref:Uncharacterized protein n=1 Tax=Xenorhabdus bovienii str. kraussei Quebec TaxID=1398203 RepID=A0A077PE89_XENBV|nr:hypothetical protein XBKQ1_180021 [Xenorhabdus bovienii str. kraussei Quebec]
MYLIYQQAMIYRNINHGVNHNDKTRHKYNKKCIGNLSSPIYNRVFQYVLGQR